VTNPFNDPKWLDRSTIVATILLEWANVSQLWRMWGERTSAGQSVIAWCSVFVALALFMNFYRAKKMTIQKWCSIGGMIMNSSVITTVLYFRYWYR